MWLIIPFKGKDEIKQRLSSRLTEQQRSDFAFAMFASLLAAFDQFAKVNPRAIEQVLVVSRDMNCLQHPLIPKFDALKCHVFKEPAACDGLNAALNAAIGSAVQQGSERALIMHADLPLVTEADISMLMNDLGQAKTAVHIVQDKTKSGTNALATPLPLDFSLQFGIDSCSKHMQQAMLFEHKVKILQHHHLAFDVDEVDDLAALLAYDLPINSPVADFLSSL